MTTLDTKRGAIAAAAPEPDEETGQFAAPEGEPHVHMGWVERWVNLAFVIVPAVLVAFAIASLWGVGVGWLHVVLMLGMGSATILGVSVGYHRLFAHRAFKTTASVRVALAIIGAMAAEGTVRRFVANHRRHHSHSDRDGDPHSPHTHEEHGVRGAVKGFWHAHIGWFTDKYREHPSEEKYAPEFCVPSGVKMVDESNGLWVMVGLIIPTVISGLWYQSWFAAGLGLLWGGVVRIFLVHHITWSVNSVCHLWGSRPFKSGDHARNNFIMGFIGMGEGWHNNHHAFPNSSRCGLKWWQFDAGWCVIWTLKKLGLAWDVRVPHEKRLAAAAQ
ncbi:acyl-CoA desaturase [Algisphaera agarilytica]|uniref:Stearoyl-CoA desaturase (Delta-9 desaturase) n=1 Tax=Algisphaera agarilytica TaxID=1385975 RepID=A0A7X0LJH9_9BACT|nr:acyl-CoA desaturase [Algisphaera agarilytica]MBB6429375.1 stearoyl-CoA desaturase (delta-9 desaturase) [Algisphaera agarilytica]